MTKARIFNETMAKGLPVTESKVINIVVDYRAQMKALLLGMRQLMVGLHPPPLPTGSIDLADFTELPVAEILRGLSTPTKGPVNQTTSPIPPTDPESDTRTRPTDDLPLLDQPLLNPPLPSGTGPSDPPPPPPAPAKVQSSAPPPSLPRPELPVSSTPVRPSPSLQTPAGPTQRNLPFSQGKGRGDPPRFSHLLRTTTGTGDVLAPSGPTPSRKEPPPIEILDSESDLDESTEGDAGSGSESVSKSEQEPVPTWKKAPATRSRRQPPKAKAATKGKGNCEDPVSCKEGDTVEEGPEVGRGADCTIEIGS